MANGGNNPGQGGGKPPTPTEQVILTELELVNLKLDKLLDIFRIENETYPPAYGG